MSARRGILNPRAGDEHFTLDRHAPAPDLAGVIERHWCVRWDLRGRAPYAQETLPEPCVNLVIGTHQPGVHGVQRARFVATLDGEGWVVATKFRPGGFRPFAGGAVIELADRMRPIADVFGPAGAALERAVHAVAASDPDDATEARLELVEDFLRARLPAPDPDVELAARAVELARADRTIRRVDELAARAGASVRALQRLFSTHVGAHPKWVIRRFRIHEAAERAAAAAPPAWAALADELGYADQAHFIRDFKAQVGRTPAEYAALCAAAAARV